MKKLCFLTGAPHCGKSTLGRRVSEIMQLPFYDTDDMVRDKIGEVRLGDIFNSYIHSRSRDIEREAILALAATLSNPAIIATGAEVALIPDCVEAMRNSGYIIHIKRRLDSILDDLRGSVDSRPVLVEVNDGTIFDFRERAVLAYADELPIYEAVAELTIENNGSEADGVNLLHKLVQAIVM